MAKKTENPESGTKPVAAPPEPISLNKKHQDQLRAIDQEGLNVKVQIANLYEQIVLAEQRQRELLAEGARINQKFRDVLNRIATYAGIDVDADPDEIGGSWNFDFNTMTFTWVPKT